MLDNILEDLVISNLDTTSMKLIVSIILGLLVGLEREWSDKPAGIRTFSLIALCGSMIAIVGGNLFIAAGVFFVSVLALLLGLRDVVYTEEMLGLSLTTSASMLAVYGSGVLVGKGMYLEGEIVAVSTAALLASKRELHSFAGDVSIEEIRSAIEFAIIAFIVYPLLPNTPIDPWESINPRFAWTLVIAVSGIGLVNYILVSKYREKGFLVTGFLGGLVNSTAVVADVASRVGNNKNMNDAAIISVLLANAAMALRNAVIVIIFIPASFITVGTPLGVITVVGVGVSLLHRERKDIEFNTELSSPFSLKKSLMFGGLFAIVLLVSAISKELFGDAAFVFSMFGAGLVSSGSATASAITLYSSGHIQQSTAVYGVVSGTISSMFVKVALAYSVSKVFAKSVLIWSIVLALISSISAFGVISLFVI